jgi:hypothetical protein
MSNRVRVVVVAALVALCMVTGAGRATATSAGREPAAALSLTAGVVTLAERAASVPEPVMLSVLGVVFVATAQRLRKRT